MDRDERNHEIAKVLVGLFIGALLVGYVMLQFRWPLQCDSFRVTQDVRKWADGSIHVLAQPRTRKQLLMLPLTQDKDLAAAAALGRPDGVALEAVGPAGAQADDDFLSCRAIAIVRLPPDAAGRLAARPDASALGFHDGRLTFPVTYELGRDGDRIVARIGYGDARLPAMLVGLFAD